MNSKSPMKRLEDLPLNKKLMAVMVLTSMAVVFLSAVAFSSYELITYHRRIIKDISSTAVVVAAGCKEPLISRRAVDAQRVLLALRANPNVTAAGLYDRDGDLLARYPPNWSIGSFPLLPENGSYRIENGSLILFEPISGPDRILGTLYIRSDLVPYYAQLRSYALIVAAILAASFVISLWLADAMQKHITEPLLELVSTARIISERGDFTVRARRISGGEIGLLTDGFNRMLQRIQAQGEVEKRSEELRSFLAAIVESSDEGIIGKDLNGVVVSWNAGATRTFGYTAAEMIGRSVTMLLPAEHVADEDEILRGARRGEIQHYETVRVRKNGEQFPVSLTISPIQNAKGEVIGVSSISRDITQRRRAEEEIKRMNAELETRVRERTAELSHANAELEAFAYSVAHDLKAPLRHIDAFTRALMEDYGAQVPEEARLYLERIRKGSHGMGRLVEDLLNLSKVGRQELKRRPVRLNDVVKRVVTDVRRETAGRQIEWEIHELPEVECDAGLMRQVFYNLLSNAAKYTSKRTVAEIVVGAETVNGVVRIYVQDNGVGFNMKHAGKLFGVFQRLHSADQFEGTGVGLATVARIVKKHHGQVWAEGEVGRGATFGFSLPRTATPSSGSVVTPV